MALRFLIADDNTAHQKLTANVILFLGGKSVFASNGEEALRIAQQDAFDVVLMDLWMPQMGGVLAAARLLAHFKDMPQRPRIVAVTGHITDERIALCRVVGMDGFIPKPCQIEILRRDLQQVVMRGHCWTDGPSRQLLDVEHFWQAVDGGRQECVTEFETKARDARKHLQSLCEMNDDSGADSAGHAEALEAFARAYGFLQMRQTMASLMVAAHNGEADLFHAQLDEETRDFELTLTGARESLEEARSEILIAA